MIFEPVILTGFYTTVVENIAELISSPIMITSVIDGIQET